MNWLMNIAAWWRVSPTRYSTFNEPSSSLTTFLSCPVGIAVWQEIHPRKILDCSLISSYSINRWREIIEWMTKKTSPPCPGGRNDILRADEVICSCHHTSPLHPCRQNLRIKNPSFIATYSIWFKSPVYDELPESKQASLAQLGLMLPILVSKSRYSPSRLETIFGSGPPTWSKWHLFARGLKEYLNAKRRNQRIRNLEMAVRNIKVLKLKCRANHMRPAFKEIKHEAHMKSHLKFTLMNFSTSWDSNTSLIMRLTFRSPKFRARQACVQFIAAKVMLAREKCKDHQIRVLLINTKIVFINQIRACEPRVDCSTSKEVFEL